MTDEVVEFDALPTLGETGEHHAWDYFGRADELGTLNWITDEIRTQATGLVRTGEVIPLFLGVESPVWKLVKSREAVRHEVFVSRMGRDDVLDRFYPQGSSQWDGLGHIRFREFGYFGGRQEEDLDAGELSIEPMSRSGIIGRGVLIDAAGYFADRGTPLDPRSRSLITPRLADEILRAEGVELRQGDIAILRTGWVDWFLSLSEGRQLEMRGALNNGPDGLDCPGMDPGKATAAWLWNNRVAAIASDNPGIEAFRVRKEEGFLHRRLIALLGMPLGEFWTLARLAERCAQLQRYEFLLVSAPMSVPRGVGSPANAYAMF